MYLRKMYIVQNVLKTNGTCFKPNHIEEPIRINPSRNVKKLHNYLKEYARRQDYFTFIIDTMI